MSPRALFVGNSLILLNFASMPISRTRRAFTTGVLAALVLIGLVSSANAAGRTNRFPKLDSNLQHSAAVASAVRKSRVIVTLKPGMQLPAELKNYVHGDKLDSINAQVLDLPDNLLGSVSALAGVSHVHGERTVDRK